ncbi:MAG TPA: biotin--[acetyl-CoA-carboxylase] ligase [Planctomycetota bacterium]|nr:biotin--[acetyl-CoA-carboxylase] ligase [Planctomycetota bacterium]
MSLTPQSIRSRLSTSAIGRRIQCVGSVGSTNDVAWAAAVEGAEHGFAVFAEEQKKGRGRMGRDWFAPKGSSILCSVVLRPEIGIDRVPLITAIAALAASDTADESAHATSSIRFPNDVFIGDRKIAGVLVESRFISGRPDLFVVGIGMNVNVAAEDFPRELKGIATSVQIERGSPVNLARTARSLLESLDRWAGELDGNLRTLRRAWRERSAILGRPVRVREGGKAYSGVVEGIDPIEGLEVRLAAGPVRHFRGEHVEHLELQ